MLFLPFLLLADQSLAGTAQSQSQQKTLLVVGDSLSAGYGLQQHEGWVNLLQNLWAADARRIEVINAAISGETTDGGLARLPRLLKQHEPSHVLIELGGNDGLQGHPVDKLKMNLNKMIRLAQQSGAKVILQDMEIPSNYGRRYTTMFGEAFDEVAKKHDVVLIPFFLQSVALNKDLMQNDGIHPNKEAQPLIAEYMNNKLKPLIFEMN
nr:arylesterase [Alteromonas lipotrueiana]